MKTVNIVVTEGTVQHTINITFSGDTMPTALDEFIVDHIGGRPDTRG